MSTDIFVHLQICYTLVGTHGFMHIQNSYKHVHTFMSRPPHHCHKGLSVNIWMILLVLQLIWLLHLQRHANWRWVCLMLMCMDHLYLPWWGFMESRKWVKVRLYYFYCILFRVISLSFYIIAFCIQGHPILARITNSNWMNYHVQLYELYFFHARS